MHIQAIICEYNPFHNGHAYQIEAGKIHTGSTHTLALMSGNIVQRGHFALTDKWLRAQMALLSGADLVCELPYAYAAQSAEYFAGGAIKILNGLNCCEWLSFGSESGDLDGLQKIAQNLAHESLDFKENLKTELGQGLSFAKARENTYKQLYGKSLGAYLRDPNNILAIEYLKALIRTKSNLKPLTIKRLGSGYHDATIKNTQASATAIRKIIQENPPQCKEKLETLLPYEANVLLKSLEKNNPNWQEAFTKALLSKIMADDLGTFRTLPYMEDGLEFKLKTALKTTNSYEGFVTSLASKRIPESRIRRILMNLLLGFKVKDLQCFSADTFVPYLRVLGFNKKGQALLKTIREKSDIPIITNTRTNITRLSEAQRRCFDFDLLATDFFSLFCERTPCYHRDFLQSPLRLF